MWAPPLSPSQTLVPVVEHKWILKIHIMCQNAKDYIFLKSNIKIFLLPLVYPAQYWELVGCLPSTLVQFFTETIGSVAIRRVLDIVQFSLVVPNP